jgi:molybdopterin-guanine dinucleotide biosynthesis protein A
LSADSDQETEGPKNRGSKPGAAGLDWWNWERAESAAVGFVLAGGQSSRMGSDKALVRFGGRPLIAHAVGILKAAGLPVFIAGARPEVRASLESFAPVIPDMAAGLGPLGGVCAALESTGAAYSVFLPVDVPLMPSSLIEYLLRHAMVTGSFVTLAAVNGLAQTFPAVISRDAAPALERELSGGRLGCLAAFQTAAGGPGQKVCALPAEVLVQSGQIAHPDALPVVRWFLNINAAADLGLASLVRASRVS